MLKESSIQPHMTHTDKQKKQSLYTFMNPKDLSRLEKFKIETKISDFSFFSLPEWDGRIESQVYKWELVREVSELAG